MFFRRSLFYVGVAAPLFLFGCSTPNVSDHGIVSPDEEVVEGGVSSNDIRTVASKMCPAILSLPEIANSDGVVRVAMAPMRNSSRFVVDMNLFMKRLRLELNRYSGGKLRFFASDNVAGTRNEILKGRVEGDVEKALEELATRIVSLPFVKNAVKPVRLAVLPVVNVNFVKLNADSFLSILRAKVAERGKGKVVFVSPDSGEADYYMAGQFIAQGMKKEGMVNLVDYIGLMDERIKRNQSLDLYDDGDNAIGEGNTGNQVNIIKGDWRRRYPSLFNQLQISARLRSEPNVTKRLNVMLASPRDKSVVWERMITIEKKITSGIERAKYILSGEVSGLSKRSAGKQSDYLLITMQLVDPETNEVLWEDGYEIKKKSEIGAVYQ